jgi:uncharacterized membrane protein YkoI
MLQSNTFRAVLSIAMRKARVSLTQCILAASLALASSQALADPSLLEGDMGLASSAPSNSLIDNQSLPDEPAPPKFSPAQAAALVRTKVGGQVMSVNSQRGESGVIYGVKVLNGGRMRVINVDGQTGQLLNQ